MGNSVYSAFDGCRPTRTATGKPFGLRSIGHRVVPPHSPPGERRRVIDFAQVFWTASGVGHVRVGGTDQICRAEEVAIVLPGEEHRYYTTDAQWDVCWFTMDGPKAAAVIEGFDFPKHPFTLGAVPISHFNRLLAGLEQIGPVGELRASVALYDLLVEMAARHHTQHPTQENDDRKQLAAVQRLLQAGVDDPDFGVRELAEAVGVERTRLARQFKRAYGISPKGYLDQLRLQRMLGLLRGTRLSIAEIARQTGFTEPNYLAKFFRRKMGKSPTSYRAESQLTRA